MDSFLKLASILVYRACQMDHVCGQSAYFDPGHVVLLHLLHLLFDGGVELVLEAQRLQAKKKTNRVTFYALTNPSRRPLEFKISNLPLEI